MRFLAAWSTIIGHPNCGEIRIFNRSAKATHVIRRRPAPITRRGISALIAFHYPLPSSTVLLGGFIAVSLEQAFLGLKPLAINQAGSPFQSGMSRFFPCRTSDRDWGLIDKLIVSCKPYSLNGPYQSTCLTSWSWPMQPSPERRRVMSRVRSTKRSTKMS